MMGQPLPSPSRLQKVFDFVETLGSYWVGCSWGDGITDANVCRFPQGSYSGRDFGKSMRDPVMSDQAKGAGVKSTTKSSTIIPQARQYYIQLHLSSLLRSPCGLSSLQVLVDTASWGSGSHSEGGVTLYLE